MKKLLVALAVVAVSCASPDSSNPDVARWEAQARNVTIIRDDWGIAHVYGKTDADAVFGAIYAQAEDDFNRVETNYINSMGRLAEAEGEAEVWRDLRMKLFINPDSIKALYNVSPDWLKALMNAYADGLNFYLYKHPDVKPRVIKTFEPWMALTFSEGSIGGDIERVNLIALQQFYDTPTVNGARGSAGARAGASASSATQASVAAKQSTVTEDEYVEPSGSNGIAIAPSNTSGNHALLLINPHTSFFFRSELQMVSEEGLNAYGASTWGQFFIYQGFNDRAGWMHTSSGVDNINEFAVTVAKKDSGFVYKFGNEERPVIAQTIIVPFKADSTILERKFTVYRTHHGPVVRQADGKWIAVKLMEEPLKALTQSFSRTKSKNYKDFVTSMDLHTNSSNNTIYADADGNIAYFHANFIPKRDTQFDWTRPVDGSNPATEWKGVHTLDESPNLFNPPNGWLYNTNNWPWTAADMSSRKKSDFPSYVNANTENPRGLHALMVLRDKKDFTLDGLLAAAFDSYLPWFTDKIPALVSAWDKAPASNPLKGKLSEQIALLRDWDMRWSATSVPTSLAVFWGDQVSRVAAADARRAGMTVDEFIAKGNATQPLLAALAAASDKLAADFGNWKTPWGDINRFQRLTADIVQPFNDSGPSMPVPFTSARWGSLASFGARAYPNTKKWYGTSGNSFVAVVEFGDSVRARAVTAGGESGKAGSKHFIDQAERYAAGNLRDVYFYRNQLKGHTEREYHPGG